MPDSLESIIGTEALARLGGPTNEVATGLPGCAYTSEALLRLEYARLFAPSWIHVGHCHEIPHAGDVWPTSAFGLPILIVRDARGVVRAFHNVCRHIRMGPARGVDSDGWFTRGFWPTIRSEIVVKWSDLSEASRASFGNYDYVAFDDRPWVTPPPPGERRVAVVSSAGIHAAGDKPFAWNGHDWRSFPREQRNFHLSHISVNFDRSGFMQDRNLYLPFDRLDELVVEGSLGSVAPTHYSFMGGSATPEQFIPHAESVAEAMKAEGVNTVMLAPV